MLDDVRAIRTYAEKVQKILERQVDIKNRLQDAGETMRSLVAKDARERLDRVRLWTEKLGLLELGPALHDLAGLRLEDETRFSLLLAALLDPLRNPTTACHIWKVLMELLKGMGGRHREVVDKYWRPELLESLRIWPKRHGDEWNHLDVFGHVVDKNGYQFGLVVEVKIRQSTGERPNQLYDYHKLIGSRWPRAKERTLFLFLTDDGREPTTAEESRDDWAIVEWRSIAEMLLDVAAMDDLSITSKNLLVKAHDSVQAEILRGSTLGYAAKQLQQLAAGIDDSELHRSHATIMNLWALELLKGVR